MNLGQNIQLDDSWKELLKSEFDQEYMKNLKNFLLNELKKGKIIFPHGKEIFSALNFTPFEQVKVHLMILK